MNTLTPEALKAYRTENDLSQDEFAKKAGIAASTISRFERGAGNLSEETETKVRKRVPNWKPFSQNSKIPNFYSIGKVNKQKDTGTYREV